MIVFQKIIKSLAALFAIFLIITIFSLIVNVISSIFNNITGKELDDELFLISNEVEDLKTIKLEIKNSSLDIKKGDSFKVETNNKSIKYKEESGSVVLKDKFNNYKKSKLVITIPERCKLDLVNIEMGAGSLNIDSLTSQGLYLTLGAGKSLLNNINITKDTNIETGTGKIDVKGKVSNLDLEVGVGEVNLEGIIEGNSTINAGIGNLTLDLLDNTYKFKVSKGIGTIHVNGNNISNDQVIGDGENIINISGGIGNINVNEKEIR